jgi:NTE family protein
MALWLILDRSDAKRRSDPGDNYWRSVPMQEALVLGAGGLVGIAWETGLLTGLREEGIDLTGVSVIAGTSAGAVVGANFACLEPGAHLDDLYRNQIHALTSGTGEASLIIPDLSGVMAAYGQARLTSKNVHELRSFMGRQALETNAQGEKERLDLIRAWMPHEGWPKCDLRITAIDVEDGSLRIWNANSEASLLQAVASSCAVPALYPPVEIAGRRYMDGGVGSLTNASVARGFDLVIVIDPRGGVSPLPGEVEQLEKNGSRALVLVPDEQAVHAMGSSPLDPGLCAASAEAGRAQGRRAAATVGRFRP